MSENLHLKEKVKEQEKFLSRGLEEIIPKDGLKIKLTESLKKNKPLIVKLGVDPTSSHLHLGHSLVFRKLKDFQDCGHKIIFLIGDFTAAIGDPSGRSKLRPTLSKEDIQKNMLEYKKQIAKILNLDLMEVVYNSEFYKNFSFENFLNIASQYTIAQLLERDDFKKRYQNKMPISLAEIVYPLVQGYDSYALNADIELGGVDQTFNLLFGRAIQKTFQKDQQVCLTLPILEGLDGKEKMSKSLKNEISFLDSDKDFFGKLMSIPDELILRYIDLLSSYSDEKRISLKEGLKKKQLHPKKVKEELAYDITAQYHGKDKAKKVWDDFIRVFSKNKLPENMPSYIIENKEDYKDFLDFLLQIPEFKLKSRSEVKRFLESGSIYHNSKTISLRKEKKFPASIHLKEGDILRLGKHRFVEIKSKINSFDLNFIQGK